MLLGGRTRPEVAGHSSVATAQRAREGLLRGRPSKSDVIVTGSSLLQAPPGGRLLHGDTRWGPPRTVTVLHILIRMGIQPRF